MFTFSPVRPVVLWTVNSGPLTLQFIGFVASLYLTSPWCSHAVPITSFALLTLSNEFVVSFAV